MFGAHLREELLMNKLAVALAIATVALLDLILVVGAGLPSSITGERLIAAAVPIMDLCLLSSSALLAWLLIAGGARRLGLLFTRNFVLFAIAAVVRATGSMPPRWLLYGVDVYWSNLYLVVLSRRPIPATRRQEERGDLLRGRH